MSKYVQTSPRSTLPLQGRELSRHPLFLPVNTGSHLPIVIRALKEIELSDGNREVVLESREDTNEWLQTKPRGFKPDPDADITLETQLLEQIQKAEKLRREAKGRKRLKEGEGESEQKLTATVDAPKKTGMSRS